MAVNNVLIGWSYILYYSKLESILKVQTCVNDFHVLFFVVYRNDRGACAKKIAGMYLNWKSSESAFPCI